MSTGLDRQWRRRRRARRAGEEVVRRRDPRRGAQGARIARACKGANHAKPNNLLEFLRTVARNAQNVILGTATPIQLDAVELWDLLAALNQGAPQVLGTPFDGGEWMREDSIQFLTGDRPWPTERHQPLGSFPQSAATCRRARGVSRYSQRRAACNRSEVLGPRFDDLGPDVRGDFLQEFRTLAERHNPIVRRVVRRTRPMLEERGLLKRIGVITHPRPDDGLPSTLVRWRGPGDEPRVQRRL